MITRYVTALGLLYGIASSSPAEEILTFERDVRPIFKAHCFHCHGEDGKREGGLDLRLRRLIVNGGESGGSIEPGKPEDSYLLDRVVSGEMPPGDEAPGLSQEEIRVLTEWIQSGAASRGSPLPLNYLN